jgi:hypothetical protein
VTCRVVSTLEYSTITKLQLYTLTNWIALTTGKLLANMTVPQRLLLSCVLVAAATIFLLERQQRIMDVSTAYTRGASVIHFGATDSSSLMMESRPPLSALVGDNAFDIKQDVQFLMDFAIVGHPKTATSTTLQWLGSHKEIQVYPSELHTLQMGTPAEHVRVLYNLTAGSQYKRGYKAPRDVGNPKVLQALSDYWPETKLIVGLRHPVSWFQSFYNFRVRHGYDMPPAETMVGKCRHETYGVCTDEALFHIHLSYLGKTNRSTTAEEKLLKAPSHKVLKNLPRLPNPVFLYEISQLHDANQTRADQYRSDLQAYLGLRQPLDPVSAPKKENKINVLDICEEKYSEIRAELMKHAKAASVWIREYFLEHPDVTVSSQEHFKELLVKWMTDPCLEEK